MIEYSVSQIATLAGPPVTVRILRQWDEMGLLRPARSVRPGSFPGASVRVYNENAAIAAMSLAELRRRNAAPGKLRKAGAVPSKLLNLSWLIFDVNSCRWWTCRDNEELRESTKQIVGPMFVVDLEQKRSRLALLPESEVA